MCVLEWNISDATEYTCLIHVSNQQCDVKFFVVGGNGKKLQVSCYRYRGLRLFCSGAGDAKHRIHVHRSVSSNGAKPTTFHCEVCVSALCWRKLIMHTFSFKNVSVFQQDFVLDETCFKEARSLYSSPEFCRAVEFMKGRPARNKACAGT